MTTLQAHLITSAILGGSLAYVALLGFSIVYAPMLFAALTLGPLLAGLYAFLFVRVLEGPEPPPPYDPPPWQPHNPWKDK